MQADRLRNAFDITDNFLFALMRLSSSMARGSGLNALRAADRDEVPISDKELRDHSEPAKRNDFHLMENVA